MIVAAIATAAVTSDPATTTAKTSANLLLRCLTGHPPVVVGAP
jgi:hypothetical protein